MWEYAFKYFLTYTNTLGMPLAKFLNPDQKSREIAIKTDIQTYWQLNQPTDKQTDRQTDSHVIKHTDIMVHLEHTESAPSFSNSCIIIKIHVDVKYTTERQTNRQTDIHNVLPSTNTLGLHLLLAILVPSSKIHVVMLYELQSRHSVGEHKIVM